MLGVPAWFKSVTDVGVPTRLSKPEAPREKAGPPIPTWRWIGNRDEMCDGQMIAIGQPGPALDAQSTYLPEIRNSEGQILRLEVQWPQNPEALPLHMFDPPYVEYAEGGHYYHWTCVVPHIQAAMRLDEAQGKMYVVIDDPRLHCPVSGQRPMLELWDELAMMAREAREKDREVLAAEQREKSELRKIAIIENMVQDKELAQVQETVGRLTRSLSDMQGMKGAQAALPKALWLYDAARYPEDVLPDSSSSGDSWSSDDTSGSRDPEEPAPAPMPMGMDEPPPPPRGMHLDGSRAASRAQSRASRLTSRRAASPPPSAQDLDDFARDVRRVDEPTYTYFIQLNENATPPYAPDGPFSRVQFDDYDAYRGNLRTFLRLGWVQDEHQMQPPPEGYTGDYPTYNMILAEVAMAVRNAIEAIRDGKPVAWEAMIAEWDLMPPDKQVFYERVQAAIREASAAAPAVPVGPPAVGPGAMPPFPERPGDRAYDAARARLAQQQPAVVRRGNAARKQPARAEPPARAVAPTTPAARGGASSSTAPPPTPPTKPMRRMNIIDEPSSPPAAARQASEDGEQLIPMDEWKKLDVKMVRPGRAKIPSLYGDAIVRVTTSGRGFMKVSLD